MKLLLCGAAAAACALSTSAMAQEFSPDNYLLGDLGGVRTKLHDNGVDFTLAYTNEFATNVRGGARKEATIADQILLGADLDLEKIANIKGMSFHSIVVNRGGDSLNQEAELGTFLNPQEIFGYGKRFRIVQFYLQQKLLNDRVTVKLGKLPMTVDVFPFSCKFQNLSFCASVPAWITPNWFGWSASQWAGVVNAKVGKEFEVVAALYQVNPNFALTRYSMSLGSPGRTTGYNAVGEVAWKPSFSGKPGTYRVGVWHNTGDFLSLYRNSEGEPLGLAGGTPRKIGSADGYYLMAEQTIIQSPSDPNRGVSVFANFIRSDPRVTNIDSLLEGGFFWKGPFASRPADEIGFGIGRLKTNSRTVRRIEEQNSLLPADAPRADVPHIEYPMELFYSAAITPAITVRPNIQYTINPGGLSSKRDVMVFGLKSSVNF